MDALIICLGLIMSFIPNCVAAELNFVYQKDMSEHCRRRVAPSIFLGRQVVEANSRIMQFSRLDLPYNCFISVRTESGSNLVMVIMELAMEELKRSCKANSEQLLVYEMGETFGGYWGPMPDMLTRQEMPRPTLYTLKTTQSATTTRKPRTTTTKMTVTTKAKTTAEPYQSSDKFIEVEVPLLNISIELETNNNSQPSAEDLQAQFEYKYDVTPIPGVYYQTSILPLVQFRLKPGITMPYPDNTNEGALRYDLDIVQEFTPDMRLILPLLNLPSKKRKSKQRYQPTKRLNFRKHKTFWDPKGFGDFHHKTQIVTRRMNDVTNYKFPTTKAKENTQDTWKVVKDLMKKLAESNVTEKYVKTKQAAKDYKLLEKISDMNHTKSVYLSPNLTIFNNEIANELYTKIDVSSTKEPSAQTITNTLLNIENFTMHVPRENVSNSFTLLRQTELSSAANENYSIGYQQLYKATESKSATETLKPKETGDKTSLTLVHGTIISTDSTRTNISAFENSTSSNTENGSSMFGSSTATVNTPKTPQTPNTSTKSGHKQRLVTGSMVGHESWDNLVQAAPEMAVLLNQSVPYDIHNASVESNTDLNGASVLNRKKKEMHAISIEESRPHRITTKTAKVMTTSSGFNIADMQEFAQLVELQDDELNGRVVLRFPSQYVGPSLFNLCNYTESTRRHVHLFNSSHILLAINNFTLERMVVILTAARTLLSGESRCPHTQIECQVAGARVCLDSLAACDGVPSCGSYDIYDEDRHQCHATYGLPHNVYLAAFTFLAVLLTLLYAVHYWLNRCVPKVADAFFVYTDGVENILYLDSIMRSPNDSDDMPKMVYHGNTYGDMHYDDNANIKKPVKKLCQQCLQALCFCCRKKKSQNDERRSDESHILQLMPRKMYSFQELEISKMFTPSKEIAVQTGGSLEMNFSENVRYRNYNTSNNDSDGLTTGYPIMIQDSLLTLEEPLPEEHKDELSLIKFMNTARTGSFGQLSTIPLLEHNFSEDMTIGGNTEELEMGITALDYTDSPQPGPSKRKITSQKAIAVKTSSHKHLRFDEVTSTIPSIEEDEESAPSSRRSIVSRFGKTGRGHTSQLDTIEETDENKSVKESRHFWGKAKKQKKKAQVSLR